MKKSVKVLSVPNLLSISRLFFGIAVFILLVRDMRVAAFFVFVIGALTDHWDGAIARRFNLRSQYGAMLDALFDRVLVLFALIGLLVSGNLSSLLMIVFITWAILEGLFAIFIFTIKKQFWLNVVHRDSIRFAAVFGFALVAWGIIGWSYLGILAGITGLFMLLSLFDYYSWLSGRRWKTYEAVRKKLKKTRFKEYLNGE